MSQTLSLGYNRTHPSSSPHEAFSIEFERYRCLSADPIRSLCRSCGYSHMNSASHPFPSSWRWELCVCFWTLIDLTPWELAAWSIRCSFQKPGHFGKYMLKMAAPQSSSFWRTSWTGNFRSPPFPPPPELLCATCSSCVFRPEISGIVRRVRILLAKTKLYLAHKSHSVSITLLPLTSPFMLRYLMLSLQPSQQLRSMDKRTKRLNGLVKVTGQVLERWPEFGIAWCCHFQALHVTLSMLLDILRFSYGRKKKLRRRRMSSSSAWHLTYFPVRFQILTHTVLYSSKKVFHIKKCHGCWSNFVTSPWSFPLCQFRGFTWIQIV